MNKMQEWLEQLSRILGYEAGLEDYSIVRETANRLMELEDTFTIVLDEENKQIILKPSE
jgi:hypothetical protein